MEEAKWVGVEGKKGLYRRKEPLVVSRADIERANNTLKKYASFRKANRGDSMTEEAIKAWEEIERILKEGGEAAEYILREIAKMQAFS